MARLGEGHGSRAAHRGVDQAHAPIGRGLEDFVQRVAAGSAEVCPQLDADLHADDVTYADCGAQRGIGLPREVAAK